ncbi:MAG: hypothetical protein AB7V36_04340 [Bacteroidales bacterium]
MKNFFRIFALLLFVLTVSGANAQNTATRDSEPTEQSPQAVFSIKVLFHCANGKALLETELPKKRGVISAIAHLDTKIVDITYNTQMTGPDAIKEYIHQIGYLCEGDPADTKLKHKACSHGENHEE